MTRQLAIRFDVDTHRCVREGMPALVELGSRLDAPFTFFVNMGRAVSLGASVASAVGGGPDSRSVAPKLPARTKLGARGWLEAALLNPRVGAGAPEVLRRAAEDGHEVGLHGGRNHARWQMEAQGWPAERLEAEIDAVLPLLREALGGERVRGFASPGWTTHPDLPRILAERGFQYLADLHGPVGPHGRAERSSAPSGSAPPGAGIALVRTHLTGEPGGVAYLEHLRAVGLDDEAVVARARSDLRSAGSRVALYDHPYHAGILELDTLERIVGVARDLGYRLVRMAEMAGVARDA